MSNHTDGQESSGEATAATAATATTPESESESASAAAGPQIYTATLQPANNSGVSGQAILILDDDNNLTVAVDATGLEPNQVHPQHIHGLVDEQGNSVQSVPATPAQDADSDGFVETPEGASVVGPPILNLITPSEQPADGQAEQTGQALQAGSYPTAAADGTVSFQQTYDLSDTPALADSFTGENLLPLTLRVVELHGLTVPDGAGAGTPGDVDGTGGYKQLLPVAAGRIEAFDNESGIVLLGQDDTAASSDFVMS